MKFIETCAFILAGIWFGFLAVACNCMLAHLVTKHFILLDRYAQIGIAAFVQIVLFGVIALCIHQAGILRKRRAIIRAIHRSECGRKLIRDLDYDLRDEIKFITR